MFKNPKDRQECLSKTLLLSPSIMLLVIFTLLPLAYTLVLSFYGGNGTDLSFVGLSNYQELMDDPRFHQALINTVIMILMIVPVLILVSFLVAFMVNTLSSVKFRDIFNILFFIPCITSPIAYSLFFKQLAYDGGILTTALESIGIYYRYGLLGDTISSRLYISLICIWSWFGYYNLLFSTALEKINPNILNAARLEGVSTLGLILKIVLPLIKPIFSLVTVLGICNTLQIYIEVAMITKGGPSGSTFTLTYYLYQKSFTFVSEYGYSATLGVVMLILSIIIGGGAYIVGRRKNES